MSDSRNNSNVRMVRREETKRTKTMRIADDASKDELDLALSIVYANKLFHVCYAFCVVLTFFEGDLKLF